MTRKSGNGGPSCSRASDACGLASRGWPVRRSRNSPCPVQAAPCTSWSIDGTARVRELNLYRQYFELVAAGTKTIEVRVKYPHLADLAAGDTIRFRIKGTDETCTAQVLRASEYTNLQTLLDSEGPTSVNPTTTRDEQLVNIRAIYGPDEEALGALAIEIELSRAVS